MTCLSCQFHDPCKRIHHGSDADNDADKCCSGFTPVKENELQSYP